MTLTATTDLRFRKPLNVKPERRKCIPPTIARERLAPSWLLAGLVLATLAILLILYPRTYIEADLRAHPQPNAATLAYLRLIVIAQPRARDMRILLAEQALSVGDISLSRYALAPWLQQGFAVLPLNIGLLRLHLLRVELYAARPGSAGYTKLAETYARSLLLLAPRIKVIDLLTAIHFVAGLGQYVTAAQLYRNLIARTHSASLRRQAFRGGIGSLLAAGKPRVALDFARAEIGYIQLDDALWRRLIRLALLADRPHLAARYARRLLGMHST